MTTPPSRAERAELLQSNGARGDVVDELLRYTESGFDPATFVEPRVYPLDDDRFVHAWEEFAAEAARSGTAATLRQRLVQLQFPIEAGISARDDYRAATLRGIVPTNAAPIAFTDPDGLSLAIHATPAGRLPIIVARARSDFELLLRALAWRNEPAPIPSSMGACIISGYNNWNRVARLRSDWAHRNAERSGDADDASDAAWQAEFRTLIPRKELYQDRFVILSTGPYSGVSAASLGLDHVEWEQLSVAIRLEHECAHNFTRRVFGSMRNSLIDELIADYTGIVASRGRFEPDWLLHFMGVEQAGAWRSTGRLANYRGSPPLSDAAFRVLQVLVRRAAVNLDRFDALVRGTGTRRIRSPSELAWGMTALASQGLERITATDGAPRLYAAYRRAERCSNSAHASESLGTRPYHDLIPAPR